MKIESVRKRVRDDPPQMLSPALARNIPNPRRQIQHSSLWQRPLYNPLHIALTIPDGFQAPRNMQDVEELCDGLVDVLAEIVVPDFLDGGVERGEVEED